jgi:hypothetical protein
LTKGEGSDDRVDRAEERKRKTAEEDKEQAEVKEEEGSNKKRQSDRASSSGGSRNTKCQCGNGSYRVSRSRRQKKHRRGGGPRLVRTGEQDKNQAHSRNNGDRGRTRDGHFGGYRFNG